MPTVLITGGTGLIGKSLTRHLTAKGYNVIILSRKPVVGSEEPMITYARWDIKQQQIDVDAIGRADYIIHLAGAGVMEKRWTENYKKEIIESRTKSSELIIKALKENKNKVKVIISASAIGWYGTDPHPLQHKYGFIESDPPAKNFLGETCRLWEASIEPATLPDKRVVKLRLGIVLSKDGGALYEFIKPLRFGIATILGNGKQVISWIHIDDLCRIFIYAMENENLAGTYNAVSPCPVSNKKLVLKLAELIRKGFHIPIHVPQFVLKLIMGEQSTEVLKSATVSSEKIRNGGFTFLYPAIGTALKELCKKKIDEQNPSEKISDV